jgi:GTP-binding protein
LNHFIDEVRIQAASGDGGHGCVSFRREKYIPRGGPDGGDGGAGGNIILRVQRNVKTLTHLRRNGKYYARAGQPGRGAGKHGADGEDVIVVVPPGTIIKDQLTGEVLLDLLENRQEVLLLKGGKGGQGNSHFATSRNQAPRYAQPGLPGESRDLRLELSLIADIGFVGFPNAGKSSLLKALTAANPKVGAYPFTTTIPNLGVMNIHDTELILADIPGIIEGASNGAGLGLQFLKHISRVAGIAVLLDMGEDVDHAGQLTILLAELASYGHGLAQLPRLIIGSKLDLDGAPERFAELTKILSNETVVGISAHNGQGLRTIQEIFWAIGQGSVAGQVEILPNLGQPAATGDHPYEWSGADELTAIALSRYSDNDRS